MKKKLVLKPFVIPTLYLTFSLAIMIGLFLSIDVTQEKENLTYVSSAILDEYVPVINTVEKVRRPYTDGNVVIANNYYDYQSSEEEQQSSILYHENTYIQNTGINYKSDNSFDVISIMKGEVIEVEEKELLGKSVTIRHENNIISVYQSLGEVSVKQGDTVKQGSKIGKSGNSKINKDLGNHLHFELYVKGQVVNPEDCYNKKISDFK